MSHGDNVPSVDAAAVPPGVYLLDVREQDEWAAGHAPGSIHIPMSQLSDRACEIPQDRDVYVICRVGGRSAQVTMALNNAGWQAVNVSGGMLAWAHHGRPMVADHDLEPFIV